MNVLKCCNFEKHWARGTPIIGLSHEHHRGDSTILVGEISQGKEGMLPEPMRQVIYVRWRHHRSPPPQFRHGTGGDGNILQPPALVV
ncbi:hypothetical protein TNCV_1610081 [Trichonephila clavipes]|nr:hypothetical protein TNCV_1610081 [Trichonephila clavipes]